MDINYKRSSCGLICTQRTLFSKDSYLNLSSANPTKWSNTLTKFIGNLPTNCLSVFDHFMGVDT